MKKVMKQLVILSFVFFFSSCLKEDHSIRLKNVYPEQLKEVQIGTAYLGDVATNATSDYKPINTGKFSISGTTSSGKSLSGSGTLSGKGKHKWTLTVSSSGVCSVAEDWRAKIKKC